MACGVHFGILLTCLVQAEHVRCLWATQARGQNSNTHVGVSQQRGGFGGSYPQNPLRQASGSPGSAQSSSFNTDPEVSTGYSQRFPSSRYAQTVSQPAKIGYASVRLAQSSSESKPNWGTTKLNQENVQKMPKKQPFGFSASIAGGSSLSKYDQTPMSKKRTRPVQQGAPSSSHYRSSSSASLQSPRESFQFSVVSETPASSGRKGYSKSMKSSSLSSTGAAASQRIPVRTKTSASAAARRVSSSRSSVGSKPRNNPSQIRAGTPYPSKLVPVNVRNLPASRTSSVETSGQGFAPSRTHNIPQGFGGYAIRRLKEPADQKEVGVRKQQQAYVAPQRPLGPPRQQAYVAPQRPLGPPRQQAYVAPQRPLGPPQQQAYVAPQRPLAPPQQQAYVAPQRPLAPRQQAYVAPQRPAPSYKPQVQSVNQEPRWKRIRPHVGQ